MKVSEMQNVLRVAGLLPEKAFSYRMDGGVEKSKPIWRVVDSNQYDGRFPHFKDDKQPPYKPITTWYCTKISALRAAMYVLENYNET